MLSINQFHGGASTRGEGNLPQTVGTQAPACLCLDRLEQRQRYHVLYEGEPCACMA